VGHTPTMMAIGPVTNRATIAKTMSKMNELRSHCASRYSRRTTVVTIWRGFVYTRCFVTSHTPTILALPKQKALGENSRALASTCRQSNQAANLLRCPRAGIVASARHQGPHRDRINVFRKKMGTSISENRNSSTGME